MPDTALPYQRHSDTSKAAALTAAERAAIQREQVFRCIREAGDAGATDDEVQAAMGLDGSSQRPRRVSLVEAGLVRDSGRERKTRKGRMAVVWVAVQPED